LTVDRWLRFSAVVDALYEREFGAQRVADMRSASLFGLLLYNLYNLTSFLLAHDVFGPAILARLCAMTPGSLLALWVIGRLSGRAREALMFAAMTSATLVPMGLFWLTDSPLGAYTFGEESLMLVFGNMVLALRYRDATIYTGLSMAVAVVAVLTKHGLDPALRFSFLVQYATACALTLDANRRNETRRCRDYLAKLAAGLRSEAAESVAANMRDLVETDALTGLPNRRQLDRVLDAWFATRGSITVMMIDVDHFKRFNDTLGHPAGDECLREIAAALKRLVEGRSRIVARFGGEEFVLAARDLEPLAAVRLASLLVKAVERLGVEHPGRPDPVRVVTASVGVAMRDGLGRETKAEVLKSADDALYEAKRRGRNRYAIADGRNARLIANG